MLFATPKLDKTDQRVLDEIDRWYDSLCQSTGRDQPREWLGGVRKRLVAGAIRGSNSIEGYTVDINAASAIVTGAAVSASIPEDTREAVTGYRDALSWVMHSSDLEFFEYSETLLSTLHFMMLKFNKNESPGRYRKSGILVTGDDPMTPVYIGPPADEVPALMSELVDWLDHGDTDAHLLIKAAMAHLNLVSVHPWRDGSGRMSRCLQTLVIAHGGRLSPEFCSIEEWLGHEINTLAYYQALRSTRTRFEPESGAHDWIKFCLKAHHIQAQVVDRRLQYGRRVWEAMAELIEHHSLNDRMVSALYSAAYAELRREEYESENGLSRDQAIRDIRKLEQAGLLESVGYGATLYYVAAGEAKKRSTAIAEDLTAPTVDPYSRD
jgi:Fic family protein